MPMSSPARTTQNTPLTHHPTAHPGHTQLSGTSAPGNPTATRRTVPSPPTRPPPSSPAGTPMERSMDANPQDKAKNAHCSLCMAIDSDLHWICECPCPALQEPRETLLRHTIPQLIRDTLSSVERQHPEILPQLGELCRALQHGLLHHPQREHLWKGA